MPGVRLAREKADNAPRTCTEETTVPIRRRARVPLAAASLAAASLAASALAASALFAAGGLTSAAAADHSGAVPSTVVRGKPGYVALGDSYSAGAGTRSQLRDGTDCGRSEYAYPSLVAREKGLNLALRACRGAGIRDVATKQLGAVTAQTSFITVSVGGNDAGFVPTMIECAKPAWMSNCTKAINKAQGIIRSDLPGRWQGLFGQIRARAPRATFVVVGYPRLFNGTDCNAATFFSRKEMERLNQTADQLNAGLVRAASTAGARFVDPVVGFTGHAVCDGDEWINGASIPLGESYHPNRAGHTQGYRPMVKPLAPAGPTMPAAHLSAAPETTTRSQLTLAARRHAAVDRTIPTVKFRLPDLTTPAARAAADRAGIDLSDPVSIGSWDR